MHGCDISLLEEPQEGHLVKEGAIFYHGEIWHVYENIIEYEGVPVWAFYKSYDPDGNKVFKDGLQHNTHEIRKAVLCPENDYPPNTLYTLPADEVENVKDVFLVTDWGVATLINGSTVLPGSSLTLGKVLGRVILQGQIRNPYIVELGVTVMTLPSGFIPLTQVSGILPCKVHGTTSYINLRYLLGIDGNLKFFSEEQSYDVDIDLSITFLSSLG